jgi:hypothetical protein
MYAFRFPTQEIKYQDLVSLLFSLGISIDNKKAIDHKKNDS